MSTSSEPQLAPPGAGLPTIELFVARLAFRLGRSFGNRQSFTEKLAEERTKIHSLTRGVSPDAGAQRVLIPRPRGLEDSSRNWSVWMTLDHLRIVNESVTRILTALGSGQIPEGTASTATVKPSPGADAAVAGLYEASNDAVLATAAAIPNLQTAARFPHPWFGPLDAAGWYALVGVHLGIHRVQIERILAPSARR